MLMCLTKMWNSSQIFSLSAGGRQVAGGNKLANAAFKTALLVILILLFVAVNFVKETQASMLTQEQHKTANVNGVCRLQ